MDAIPESEVGWLQCFFSGRNALHWNALETKTAHPQWLEQVTPWLSLFAQEKDNVPIVLPVFDAAGPAMWYAAARSESATAALGEELTSMIGPSYSNFRGQRHACDAADAIEAALAARFGGAVFRVSPLPGLDPHDITKAVARYLSLLRRRPDVPDRTQQPFGKIRGDFDRALLAGNEQSATRLLEALCATGRVNAEQRKFLEIRFLAGLGRYEELARSRALIKSVMDISLPPQTIIDLVDALYRTYIAHLESSADASVVAGAFKQHIGQQFAALFKERKGIRHSNVLKSFLLYELTQEAPDSHRCDAIAAAFSTADTGSVTAQRWIEQLRLPGQPKVPDTLEAARQAVADEEYERAVPLYEALLPDLKAYSGLIRCAVELGSAAVTAKVIDLVQRGGTAVVERLNERDKKRLAALSQSPATELMIAPLCGWVQWAEAVVQQKFSAPIQVLESEMQKWAVEDYAADAHGCEMLASIIGNAGGVAENVFREAFPHLVEFFVDRPPSPVRGFIPLYIMLLRIVAWNGSASVDELELTTTLVHALLRAGPNSSAYIEGIDALSEIFNQNCAPSNIDWALNLSEILAIYPAADAEARLRLFMAVINLLQSNSHRVTEAQMAVLRLLVKDYGCEQLMDGFPSQDSDQELPQARTEFSGIIAIYTLTETAGQRAKQLLEKLLPKARVELNSDFVASDRLKHLAASAEVFVFAWRSSKHQAYYCVKEARGDRPLQLPVGKGTASIVQSALGAILVYA